MPACQSTLPPICLFSFPRPSFCTTHPILFSSSYFSFDLISFLPSVFRTSKLILRHPCFLLSVIINISLFSLFHEFPYDLQFTTGCLMSNQESVIARWEPCSKRRLHIGLKAPLISDWFVNDKFDLRKW